MFRTGKYKKKIVASGWNMPMPQLIQKIEKLEAKKDEEQTKQDRKKLFQAWQRF